jgi:acyl-CoA synthetase (NDP forming)
MDTRPDPSSFSPASDSAPRHRLSRLLSPRSIALIGASDRSNWSHRIHNALDFIGYDGDVFYVNPKGGTAHGLPVHRSVLDLDVVPDLAYVMIPGGAVQEAMKEVVAAGIPAAVVLSSGFAEVGAAGQARQDELAALTRESGVVVLGPNALGYVNLPAKVALKPVQPGEELLKGSIGIVSQSGNVTVQIMNMSRSFHVGLSYMVSTGNEMDVTVADVVDYLADDPSTTVIAVFAETFKEPDAFVRACRKAKAAGKPVVVLKVGRSEAAARSAMAHTGSLVGDDAVIDAFLHAAGAIRVTSLEDLLTTADTFAHTGPIRGHRVAFLAISGGTCDIAADTAEDTGVVLAEFDPGTVAELVAVLPDYATVQNPLDVTGAAVVDAELFGKALSIVARDPHVDVAIAFGEIDHQAPDSEWGMASLTHLVAAVDGAGSPAALANTSVRHLSERTRDIRSQLSVPTVFGGVDRIIPALRRIIDWTARPSWDGEAFRSVTVDLPAATVGVWSEAMCRSLLEQFDIPVAPGTVAATPAEAGEAARFFGRPVAIKVVSSQILHKSDVGGVALGVEPGEVEAETARMLDRVHAAVPSATVDGVLVSPMIGDGLDLLVGVVRDPAWGCVMALGLGGIWTEVLQDVRRIALPASPDTVRTALRGLRAAPLLEGARGTEPVDLDVLVDVVGRIGSLALALGEELAALEVNPLRVDGADVTALDAAVVWREDGADSAGH